MSRWVVLAACFALIAGVITFDRLSPLETVPEVEASADGINPALSPDPKLNQAWYCPAGSGEVEGTADHEISVVNLADQPAVATISVLTQDGLAISQRVELPALGTQTQKLSELTEAESAGAIVEVVGGEGVVGHTVVTDQGEASGACSTEVADTWSFAGGRTTEDSKQYLTLMNPFSDDVVFDIEFRLDGRPEPLQREAFQGQALKAMSVKRIDIGEEVSPEDNMTVTVTTRGGKIAVERLQMLDGSRGPTGAALQLGLIEPASSWIFPAGRLHDGGGDQLVIWNPSADAESTVEVGFWPVDPEDRTVYGLAPVERTIPPQRFEVIDLVAEGKDFGFELPYEVGVTVSGSSPVLVERWHLGKDYEASDPEPDSDADQDPEEGEQPEDDAESDADQAEEPEPEPADQTSPYEQPTATAGLATSKGIQVVAKRWVVPWVSLANTQLVITAAEDASVTVEIQGDGELLEQPTQLDVVGRGRQLFDVAVNAPNGAIIVTSDTTDIAVEVQLIDDEGRVDIVPGVPTV